MWDLLKKFENKQAEIVFEWNDNETEAVGWVVINSLRNGAAGGGTRMRPGLDRREVESLAKTMEIKFTISGPQIGGAKSGINFDPHDPRKQGVLERWYKAVIPLLKNYYGTGGDLNVDEIHEVIPITEDLGLWHPQEGVVNGYFNPNEPEKIRKIGQLRQGVSKVIEDPEFIPSGNKKYHVADMITGYGVAQAVRSYYEIWGGELQNKKAIIQGWGNVGSAAAYFLAKWGVSVVGIIDKAGGVIKSDGLSYEEIKQLFVNKIGNTLIGENLIPFEKANEIIWNQKADIFIPAAGSRLIKQEELQKMIENGLEVISSGANVPFADPEIFMGPIGKYADQNLALIPDFIANCGMARVFAYLMETNKEITDQSIFNDTRKVIHKALSAVHDENSNRTKLAEKAFEISLRQLI
ncbi:amino acid dehydrogenase [Hyphobacterium sp. CCMP332]|nr:amino acid dehydrogenase [Hyphobacterium sp. CCMP332]